MLHLLKLVVLFAVFATNLVQAQDIPAYLNDAVNHIDRTDADRERDKTSKPAEVLAFFGVKPGMRIADMFSGGGYYSEILSHAVGDTGKVLAHNNKAYLKYVGEGAEERFANSRLTNVERLNTEFDNLGLGEASLDMILIVMSYHDIYFIDEKNDWPAVDRVRFFDQVHKALKPNGILAIIDHSAKAGTGKQHAQDLHRIESDFAKKDIESAGFVLDADSELLRSPEDDLTLGVFDEKIRRKTDRFVHRYRKEN